MLIVNDELKEEQVDKAAQFLQGAIEGYICTEASRLGLSDDQVTVIVIKALQRELKDKKDFLIDLRRPANK